MRIEKNVPDKYIMAYQGGIAVGKSDMIAFPESTEDVQEIVKRANEEDAKIVPIGSQTGLAKASYPNNGSWLISTSEMNKILSFDEETLTLNVQAGVRLQDVIDYLADTDYFYAPDPGQKRATIGGNVNTNAGGMRAVRYGVTRDNIRGFDVVLANGETIHCGSLNNKDASGYDLKDLFIGSEGTLGIITELQLKVIPRPRYEKSILIGYNNVTESAPTVGNVLKSTLRPVAIELLEANGVKFSEEYISEKIPEIAGGAQILVTLAGSSKKDIDDQIDELLSIATANNAIEHKVLEDEEHVRTWKVRDNILTGIAAAGTWKMYDPCVPTNHFTDLVADAKKLGEELNIDSAFFGHAGDGNIHICVLQHDYSDEEWKELLRTYEDRLYDMIRDFGGLPSAEHAIGREKKPYFKRFHNQAYFDVLLAVKHALDPKNMLNPGVTYTDD
ncbi:FAD-binding oxidoreductase [Aerococcus vaginalis]